MAAILLGPLAFLFSTPTTAGASAENVNTQTYINNNTVKVLNESITNAIANTIVNNASNCGTSIIQNQNIDFSNITAKGNIDINNIYQHQGSGLSFSCQQTQETRSEVANKIYQEMVNDLIQNNNTRILANLEAEAQASAKSGFLSGGSSAGANTSNKINFNQTNNSYQEIQNVIQDSIENNFTTNNVANCNTQTVNNQNIGFHAITSETGNIVIGGITQDQGAEIYAQCLQGQEVSNKITNDIINALGVKVENTNTVETETNESGIAVATAESSGFSLGLGSGSSRISSILCIILICCLCISAIIYFVLPMFSGGKGSGTSSGTGSQTSASDLVKLAAVGGAYYLLPNQSYFSESSIGMTVHSRLSPNYNWDT